MSEINIRRLLARLQEAADTADEQSLITQSYAAIDALQSELEAARRDAESWYEQARARTADAVQFAQERDAMAQRAEDAEQLATARGHTIQSLQRELSAVKVERDALAAKLKEQDAQIDDLLAICHRLALELECLLLDTKDLAPVSRWWDSAMAALDGWHKAKDAASVRPVPTEPVNARLVDIARRTVGIIENTSIEAGFCCCGEGMDGHASAMMCGHSATDQGAYLANELHKEALEAIAAAEAQQAEPVRLTDEEIASLLAASDKNSPRVPSFFMTEPHKFARAVETVVLRKNGLEVSK